MPENEDKIGTVSRAIHANPNDPFAWYTLGVRCYARHCPSEALECFEKAETIKKGFSAANRYYLALCQRELGRTRDSLHSLMTAADMNAINAVDKKARSLARRMLDSMEGKKRSDEK
uniref:TPR_REGION domain-containing protein n=1 Tax=Heterorhabditis bacteriophora TaxID=37862 RepID=A0A1I7X5V2_HETBA